MGQKTYFGEKLGLVKEIICVAIRHVAMFVLALVVILGVGALYDILVGDSVPIVYHVGSYSKEGAMAGFNTTQHQFDDFEVETAWESLQPTLQILNRACPKAKLWAEYQFQHKNIVWELENTNTYAQFNYITKELTINRALFAEKDGVKAAILAHEYRHSVQNWSKYVRYCIAQALLGQPKSSIIEDDAYLFENEVMQNIFN